MAYVRTGRDISDSPEDRVVPYEDFNTRQNRITGEKFPSLDLGLCDKCHWCYTLLNKKGALAVCPLCKARISLVPMTLEEVCIIEENERHGLVLSFDRKLPLR